MMLQCSQGSSRGEEPDQRQVGAYDQFYPTQYWGRNLIQFHQLDTISDRSDFVKLGLIQGQYQLLMLKNNIDKDMLGNPETNDRIQTVCKIIVLLSSIYLVTRAFELFTLFVIIMALGSFLGIVACKWALIRKKGIINVLSPKMRSILLQRSIFDIYSDLLYFPLVTKVIGCFLKPAIAKPAPENLHQSFEELPIEIQQKIATKGILHLAPSKIEAVVLRDPREKELQKDLPEFYGKSDWSWYNLKKYEKEEQQVHQQTMKKHVLETIDKKISWSAFVFLLLIVSYGIKEVKMGRMKKMFVQNASFTGVLLVLIVGLVKISQNRKKKA